MTQNTDFTFVPSTTAVLRAFWDDLVSVLCGNLVLDECNSMCFSGTIADLHATSSRLRNGVPQFL